MRKLHTLWLLGVALVALSSVACDDDTPESAFYVEWTVRDPGGFPVPCSSVGATTVRFTVVPITNTGKGPDIFDAPCGNGAFQSPTLREGDYMLTAQLLGAQGQEIQRLGFDTPVRISRVALTVLDTIPFQPGGGVAAFFLDWNLQYVGGGVVTCQAAGANEVVVNVVGANGAGMDARFPCTAGQATTPVLSPGPYTVTVSLVDAANNVIAATDPFQETLAATGTDLGMVPFDIQSFTQAWTVTKAGAATNCAAVGATTVELTAQLAGGPAPYVFRFDCAAGSAASPAVRVGAYTISYRLLNAANAAVATAGPVAFTATATQRAALPPVTFAVP